MDQNINGIIKRLQNFENSLFPILSIYLGSCGKKFPRSSLLLSQLDSMTGRHLSRQDREIFKQELGKVENYLQQTYNKKEIHSLAFFTTPDKLWEVISFDFYLPPFCVISYSPYIKPITEAMRW